MIYFLLHTISCVALIYGAFKVGTLNILSYIKNNLNLIFIIHYFQKSIIFILPYIILEFIRLFIIFYTVITSMILIKMNVLDFLFLIFISVIGVFLLRKFLKKKFILLQHIRYK